METEELLKEIKLWREKAEQLEIALKQYAFSLHWGPVYGSGEQEYRMWLGPGQGWELANQALKGNSEIATPPQDGGSQ